MLNSFVKVRRLQILQTVHCYYSDESYSKGNERFSIFICFRQNVVELRDLDQVDFKTLTNSFRYLTVT